ncbi:hypothetical protein GCM10027269_10510 [Kribbella endophytica]
MLVSGVESLEGWTAAAVAYPQRLTTPGDAEPVATSVPRRNIWRHIHDEDDMREAWA